MPDARAARVYTVFRLALLTVPRYVYAVYKFSPERESAALGEREQFSRALHASI
jgi:hypothetical protein